MTMRNILTFTKSGNRRNNGSTGVITLIDASERNCVSGERSRRRGLTGDNVATDKETADLTSEFHRLIHGFLAPEEEVVVAGSRMRQDHSLKLMSHERVYSGRESVSE